MGDSLLSRSESYPILIPEGGLTIPASVWQVSLLLLLPAIAVVGVAIPILFAVCGTAWVVSTVWDLIDPPQKIAHKKISYSNHENLTEN